MSRAPAWSRSRSACRGGGCRESSLSRNFPFLRTSQPKAPKRTAIMPVPSGFGLPAHPLTAGVPSERSRRMYARGEHARVGNTHGLAANQGGRIVPQNPITRAPDRSCRTSRGTRASGDGAKMQHHQPIRVPSTSLAMHCAGMVDPDDEWIDDHTGSEMSATVAAHQSRRKSDSGDIESLSHLHASLPSIPEDQCCSPSSLGTDDVSRKGHYSHTSAVGSSSPGAERSSRSLGIDGGPLAAAPPLHSDALDTISARGLPINQRSPRGDSRRRRDTSQAASAACTPAPGATPSEECPARDSSGAVVLEDSARDPSQPGSLADLNLCDPTGDAAQRLSGGTPEPPGV